MQIQFDPRDPSQLATVARIVSALQGGAAIVPYDPAEPNAVTISTAEMPPVVNAADVFAAPPLPPVTVPVAPRGDIDDADDEPHAAVPVQAPGDDPDEEPGNAAPPVSPAEHTAAVTTPTPPPAPSQPVAAAPAGVDVDKNGFPWDARIHSGPADKRPKNADGTWRRRRGTDDATVAQVEAELRQIMAAGNAVAGAPVPPAPVAAAPTPAPTPPPPTPVAADTAPGPVVATTAPSAPPAPPVPPVAAPTPAARRAPCR